jgi:hypothetical protein
LSEYIYEDQIIINEFLGKRNRMHQLLKAEGIEVSEAYFNELDYNEDFDKFLYQQIGYDRLVYITMGLFASPYAATSLREYFANGFEYYFLKDPGYINKISRGLYEKIENLVFKEHEE